MLADFQLFETIPAGRPGGKVPALGSVVPVVLEDGTVRDAEYLGAGRWLAPEDGERLPVRQWIRQIDFVESADVDLPHLRALIRQRIHGHCTRGDRSAMHGLISAYGVDRVSKVPAAKLPRLFEDIEAFTTGTLLA